MGVTLESHEWHQILECIFPMIGDFYITLLSASCLSTFRNNRQCKFTVKLEYPMQISEDDWEVCMTGIMKPIKILTISEGNYCFFLAFPNLSILKGYGTELNSDV